MDDIKNEVKQIFFQSYIADKIIIPWRDTFAYGKKFLSKMDDYSKIINDCALTFFLQSNPLHYQLKYRLTSQKNSLDADNARGSSLSCILRG